MNFGQILSNCGQTVVKQLIQEVLVLLNNYSRILVLLNNYFIFLNKNFTNIKVLLSDNDYVSDYRKQNDLYREVSPTPFIPNNDKEMELRCQEIFSIQTCALAKRLEQLNKNSKIPRSHHHKYNLL